MIILFLILSINITINRISYNRTRGRNILQLLLYNIYIDKIDLYIYEYFMNIRRKIKYTIY